METIKDVWYAVVFANKITSIHPDKNFAEMEAEALRENELPVVVERVQVVITRIPTH